MQGKLEEVEGVVTAVVNEVLTAAGQAGLLGTGLVEQRQGQGTILGVAGPKDQGQRQFALEINDPDQAVAELEAPIIVRVTTEGGLKVTLAIGGLGAGLADTAVGGHAG